MDPTGVGVLLGLFGLMMIGAGVYIYDRCVLTSNISTTTNPLLTKKRPFRVKNLFSHVEI